MDGGEPELMVLDDRIRKTRQLNLPSPSPCQETFCIICLPLMINVLYECVGFTSSQLWDHVCPETFNKCSLNAFVMSDYLIDMSKSKRIPLKYSLFLCH